MDCRLLLCRHGDCVNRHEEPEGKLPFDSPHHQIQTTGSDNTHPRTITQRSTKKTLDFRVLKPFTIRTNHSVCGSRANMRTRQSGCRGKTRALGKRTWMVAAVLGFMTFMPPAQAQRAAPIAVRAEALRAQPVGANWLSYNGDYSGRRYA